MAEMTKNQLMLQLQQCDFALNELNLFLDTHPDNLEALMSYKLHLESRKKIADEYTINFGPIDCLNINDYASWNWVDEPWPWEKHDMEVD